MSEVRPLVVRLTVVAFAILGALSIAEVALQVAAWRSRTIAYRLARHQPHILSDPVLGHRPHPFHPDHDARGFRNAEVPVSPPCLVAFGDSQTYGHHVLRRQAWPQRVAQVAGVSTYNMAFGGWGQGQALLLLDEALELQPKLAVTGLYTGNDLYDAYSLVHGRGQLSRLAGDDPGSADRLAALPPLPWERVLPPDLEQRERHGPVRAFLARRSKLYGVLRAARRSLHDADDRTAYEAGPWPSVLAATADRERYLVLDRPPLRTVFTPAWRLIAIDRSDARIAEGYDITVRALSEMRRRLDEAGVAFAVLLIPTKELVFQPWTEPGSDLRYDRLVAIEEATLGELTEDLELSGIPVFDALPVLRSAVASGDAPYPESADGHPNPHGQRLLADTVMQGLIERFPTEMSLCRDRSDDPGAA